MIKRSIAAVLACLCFEGLWALTGGNLYRVMMTREQVPVRLIFVRSVRDTNPEDFLIDNLNYHRTGVARLEDKTILYEKRERGKVPVLCFHRIGEDPRYELTINRTHHLMAYLQRNRYFPLADSAFAAGDFSSVPSGLKPIVIGADDASGGQVIWSDRTLSRIARGEAVTEPELDPNCLAAIFSRYFPAVEGRFNLTFYVSFDAVPFRQTGGLPHSGSPYRDLPVVREKLGYVDRTFLLGHHSITHTYLEDHTPQSLIDEIGQAEEILSTYLDRRLNLPTLAYPYGLAELKTAQKQAFQRASAEGKFPAYAFDLDGELSVLPWNRRFEPLHISRLSVENRSFETLLEQLGRRDVYTSRRTILLYAPHKNLDLDSYNLTIGGDDVVYVYVP